jgi:hypothetical protein
MASSISFWRVLISVHSPFWRVFEKNGFPHCFDDEIEMKNRSTIQTLTFVQTNPDHLYMKLNMPGTCNHPQFRFEKIGSYFLGARAAPDNINVFQ